MSGQAKKSSGVQQPSKERLRLWLRILDLSRAVESKLRENFREEFGSTLPRFDVMAALDRHDQGMKMSALSTMLRVSNGNITGLIDRLVEDGCVKRLPVPGDRRAHHIFLTKLGKAQFVKMAQAHEDWINDLFDEIGPEDAVSWSERLRYQTAIIRDEKRA